MFDFKKEEIECTCGKTAACKIFENTEIISIPDGWYIEMDGDYCGGRWAHFYCSKVCVKIQVDKMTNEYKKCLEAKEKQEQDEKEKWALARQKYLSDHKAQTGHDEGCDCASRGYNVTMIDWSRT